MLFDINGTRRDRIPHGENYRRWRANLSDEEHLVIMDKLHGLMDNQEVFNSSYIPGSDWRGTPYQPIYHA